MNPMRPKNALELTAADREHSTQFPMRLDCPHLICSCSTQRMAPTLADSYVVLIFGHFYTFVPLRPVSEHLEDWPEIILAKPSDMYR